MEDLVKNIEKLKKHGQLLGEGSLGKVYKEKINNK